MMKDCFYRKVQMLKKSKRHHKNNKYDKYEHDLKLIELLNTQAQAIKIYLIADIFFYYFAEAELQSAYVEYYGGESDNYYENIFLIKGSYLSLLASLIISNVSFIAYDLNTKNNKGIIDYSKEGDKEIITASVYTVMLFYINSIGATALYYRENLCKAEIDDGWLEISKIQLTSYIIRFFADYLTLNATLEGIELIKSKYSNVKIDYRNVQNPDSTAIMAAILYLIQRIMLFFVNFRVYAYMYDACVQIADINYLLPNEMPILGSTFGIIADTFALDGFIKIYRRNIDKPVFGR